MVAPHIRTRGTAMTGGALPGSRYSVARVRVLLAKNRQRLFDRAAVTFFLHRDRVVVPLVETLLGPDARLARADDPLEEPPRFGRIAERVIHHLGGSVHRGQARDVLLQERAGGDEAEAEAVAHHRVDILDRGVA